MSRRPLRELPGWDRVLKAAEEWRQGDPCAVLPSYVRSAGLWVPPASIVQVHPSLALALAVGIGTQRDAERHDRARPPTNVVSMGEWLARHQPHGGYSGADPSTWRMPRSAPHWLRKAHEAARQGTEEGGTDAR